MRVSGKIRRGGLGQGFEPLEAEADDVGGEAQFVLGFRAVGIEHVDGRLTGGGRVAAGAGEEERGEADEDGFQDGGWEGREEGHGIALG